MASGMKDIAERLSAEEDITQKEAVSIVSNVLDIIKEELIAEGDVRLVDFGTFKIGDRKARTGRNPATGELMQIAASKVVKFKPAKKFKEAVNS